MFNMASQLLTLLLLSTVSLNLPAATASAAEAAAAAAAMTNSSSPTQSSNSGSTLSSMQLYLWGYIGTALSVLGIVGNAVSIRVLLSPRMASSTSVYLVALGVLDSVILLLFDACMGLPLISTSFAGLMRPDSVLIKLLYPVSLFIHMCSMYVTACFTVERYLSIKFPLHSGKWCSRKRAKRIVAGILGFTLIYNVPRAFEKIHFGLDYNGTSGGCSGLDNCVTNATSFLPPATWTLQDVGWYNSIYSGFLYTVFMFVLPLLVITVSNFLLVHTIRNSTRRTQGSIGCRRDQQKRLDRDRSISLMLASVVVVFVFCQTFALVDNLMAVAFRTQSDPPSRGQQAFYVVAQFMIVLNSSVNFLLYCFFGLKFRCELRSAFCSGGDRGGRERRGITASPNIRPGGGQPDPEDFGDCCSSSSLRGVHGEAVGGLDSKQRSSRWIGGHRREADAEAAAADNAGPGCNALQMADLGQGRRKERRGRLRPQRTESCRSSSLTMAPP